MLWNALGGQIICYLNLVLPKQKAEERIVEINEKLTRLFREDFNGKSDEKAVQRLRSERADLQVEIDDYPTLCGRC